MGGEDPETFLNCRSRPRVARAQGAPRGGGRPLPATTKGPGVAFVLGLQDWSSGDPREGSRGRQPAPRRPLPRQGLWSRVSESCIKERTSAVSRRVTSGCHLSGSQSSWCHPDPQGASAPRAQRVPEAAPPPGYRDVGGCRTAVQVELLGLRHNAARVQPPPLPRQARARHKSGPRPRRRRPPTLGSRAGFP